MSEYSRQIIGKQAAELGFVRDTFEKVCRLAELLVFFERDPVLSRYLALKGGTAINLTIFNLPRLSVDIDLDFAENLPFEETNKIRLIIQETLELFMVSNGYKRNTAKSKRFHTLDSFVYQYINTGGVADNIKAEINYSLRGHVFLPARRPIESLGIFAKTEVLSVNPIEIFAAKTIALLTRAAARDLYDLNNAVYFGLFDESQMDVLRKCIVFYMAVAGDINSSGFSFSKMDLITNNKIRTDLAPVIRKKDRFDLASAQKRVKEYLSALLVFTAEEKMFLSNFQSKHYCPELLFDGDALERVTNHPMALWRVQDHER